MNNKIKLYPHNKEGYTKVKEAYDNGENVVGIVHATGTGKTYIALQLLLDNPSMKSLFVVPSNAIIEHIKETIGECGLSLKHDFPNLEFVTYQSLTTKSDEELASMDIDMLVLDEFHHIGAPVWGEQVNKIVDSHSDMKVFGMTAYTVRDRNTSYERDMALPGDNELFSDKIVSTYDIYDAMCDGVLPIPNYKSAYLNLINEIYDIESDILDSKISNELKKEYLNVLKSCKEQIDKAPKARDLIKENLKYNDKCIYFCPVNDSVIVSGDEILGTNDVQSIRNRIGHLALEVGGKTILYETTSDMGESGRLNREHFYNDTSFFRNEDVSNILRIMFAKNQYNEGVHAPGVTKVFMGRQTKSDIVFFEQLGRALSVRGNIIELTKEYESKNIEELKNIANNQCIDISKCNSKEEIIERLLAPTIVDLVGNIEFIRELKDNLKGRIRERQEKGIYTKLTRVLVDTAFDITVDNEEIYQVLQDLHNRIQHSLTIEQSVDEIYAVYEETGKMPNSMCMQKFSNGTVIGYWLGQKYNKKKIIELANKRNEKAQKIVDELKLNQEKIGLTVEQAVDEIYEIYKKTNKIPSTLCREKFSNDFLVGSWIHRNRQKLLELANQGNRKAQTIVKKSKIVLTVEQAVDEIYEIYERTGKMPNTICTERFSNDSIIGVWLGLKKNQDKIIELANQENLKAQLIVEKLGMDFTIEQAINEIYSIYETTGKMPNTQCKEKFSYGSIIGPWLFQKKNQEKLKKLSNEGNEKAKTIVEELKLNQEKIVLTIEQIIEEIYEIYERKGVMPNTTSKDKFSNNNLIGIWLSKKINTDRIIELAKQGNEKAQLIVEKLKLNFTIEQAVDEIYEIYERTGKMPNTQCKEKFSSESLIGFWLNKKNNQEKLIELASEGNEKAKLICAFLSKKTDKDKYIELCNEYNIDYEKNKKYINKVPYTLLKGIIKYFIDNNIFYVDNNGILVSDIFMSNKDFEAKYGISIIELISNQKTR